jgi:hypothetical protein
MVDIATDGTLDDPTTSFDPISGFARKGGTKGVHARAAALSPERRAEIARENAAAAHYRTFGAL